MATTQRNTALITGASRGLGLALASKLATRGWNLIINARGAQALETARIELAALATENTIVAISGDVTDATHLSKLADRKSTRLNSSHT